MAYSAWIVVSNERHGDPMFYVCELREDAVAIAVKITADWCAHYGISAYDPDECDVTVRGDRVFSARAEDRFHVYVEPVGVFRTGESNEFRGF